MQSYLFPFILTVHHIAVPCGQTLNITMSCSNEESSKDLGGCHEWHHFL